MPLFAHLTDIHLSAQSASWSTIDDEADDLLRETIDRLNDTADLDFVVITGDVLDVAVPSELARFTALMDKLQAPWHFVPGNHDGFIDPNHPDSFAPPQAVPSIAPRMMDPVPYAQKARWSRQVAAGIQLIGLDSRYADDWAGTIGDEQIAWLRDELETHRDDAVLIAVHHPLHQITPRNSEPYFKNFVADNAEQVTAVLDEHPQVKMVLSGHHHANHIARIGARVHVATASLTGYPCAYRLIRFEPQGDAYRIQISTHSPAEAATLAAGLERARLSPPAQHMDDPQEWVNLIRGQASDLTFEQVL
ncbi:MAG: metallophosphoesterase family protein [Anaerolineae bacterium]